MKKLFASDYDGTFYKHNRKKGEIAANVEQVGKWQKSGNLFIFATGRSISMMQMEKRRKLKYDYIVGLNGAVIVDKNHEILFQKAIKPETAQKIVQLIEASQIESYSITDGFKGHFKLPRKFRPSMLLFKLWGLFARTYHLSKEAALELPVVQIALTTANQDEAVAFANQINEQFEGEAFAFANLVHVDIQAPGLSKATGVSFIAEKYNVHQEAIYGMGDSFNDLPMLEAFHGLTLPEATDPIKIQASAIYETVGQALENLR